MKTVKITLILGLLISIGFSNSIYAQYKYGSETNKCKTNLSIFYEYAKVGNYAPAEEPWNWCMENCPSSSKNLYKYGLLMKAKKYDIAAGVLATKTEPTGGNYVQVGKKYYDNSKADKAELAKNAPEIRSRTIKPAAFDATERKAVTGVGAP